MSNRYQIPLSVLLYKLNIPCDENPLTEDATCIDKIILFTPNPPPSENTLIIGRYMDILPVCGKHPHTIFLCPKDPSVPLPQADAEKKNLLLLHTEASVEELYNNLLRIWDTLQQWNTDMLIAVLQGDSLQKLMDLSEPIIGNHIDIMDAAFRLLAYTKNIPIDDDVTNDLIEYGHHVNKTLERFVELRRMEEFETQDDVIISTDRKMCDYETVKRVFHTNGNIHLYVVMHCNNHIVTPGLLALFRQLLFHVKSYSDQNSTTTFSVAAANKFLRDMLERKITTVDEAIKRASYISVSLETNYFLFAISFDDSFNVPLENIVLLLSDQIPSSYVISFHRQVLIVRLIKDEQPQNKIQEKTYALLEKQLNNTPCTIGMSNLTESLWQISTALEQADCAIEYGIHLRGERPVSLFTFEECFLSLIVLKSFNSSDQLFANCFMVEAIRKISEYDQKHGTAMLDTLEAYLKCDKKATEVSKLLNIHRNTVLYHMERIQEIIGASLDDQDVCLKLQLGLMVRATTMHKWL